MGERSLEQRAVDVWVRTGRPAVAVKSMTEEQIESLVALEDSEDFRTDIDAFISDYLESLKATEDSDEATDDQE